MKYAKIWFESKHGKTAGLVIEIKKLDKMTMSEISRLFPYSEAPKMFKLRCSPYFDSWNEAFNFNKENAGEK